MILTWAGIISAVIITVLMLTVALAPWQTHRCARDTLFFTGLFLLSIGLWHFAAFQGWVGNREAADANNATAVFCAITLTMRLLAIRVEPRELKQAECPECETKEAE